jgi:hypothetical protein
MVISTTISAEEVTLIMSLKASLPSVGFQISFNFLPNQSIKPHCNNTNQLRVKRIIIFQFQAISII